MKEMALLKVGDGVLQSFFLVLQRLFYSRCSASPLSKVGDGVQQRWDDDGDRISRVVTLSGISLAPLCVTF